ncbi:hypothetical protein WUBG_07793, partial [Wuchereria bancrofti]
IVHSIPILRLAYIMEPVSILLPVSGPQPVMMLVPHSLLTLTPRSICSSIKNGVYASSSSISWLFGMTDVSCSVCCMPVCIHECIICCITIVCHGIGRKKRALT